MSTITTPDVIHKLLSNNGVYQDDTGADPQVFAVYQYTHTFSGTLCWKTIQSEHSPETREFYLSPFCCEIKLLWDAKNGLSENGIRFLQDRRPAECN